MSIVIVIILVVVALLLWPGTPGLFLRILTLLRPYDDAMFKARDIYRDENESKTRRFLFGLIYLAMIGVPLALIVLLLAFAMFGRFIAPYTSAIMGKP